MMNFFNREERFAEELAAELQPYRGNPIDYEAGERLREIEADVAAKGRHLLQSNDRYQAGALHLTAAQTHYTVADKIMLAVTSNESPHDFRGPRYDRSTVVGFLQGEYQAAKTHFSHAETILGTYAYKASDADKDVFRQSDIRWPVISALSRRFVEGAVDAADAIKAYTDLRHYDLQTTPLLSPSYKAQWEARSHADRQEFVTQRSALGRIINNGALLQHPEHHMDGAYDSAVIALGALHKVGVWLAFPELQLPLFAVRSPLAEYRPGEEPFDPNTLSSSTIRPKPSTPVGPPVRPFSVHDLKSTPVSPATSTNKPQATKPIPAGTAFDPAKLQTSAVRPEPKVTTTPPEPTKPFDPTALTRRPVRPDTPAAPQAPPFDPNALVRKPVETAPPADEEAEK